MLRIISHSEAETKKIANNFAATLKGGDVVTLTGKLGAGKTLFTKGMACALGVTKEIVSPTFAIMNVYEINLKLIKKFVHIDTYRLKSVNEIYAIGGDEYIGAQDTVTVIEWPELAEKLMRGKKIKSVILQDNSDRSRTITIFSKRVTSPQKPTDRFSTPTIL